jgi:hypothetical protein
VLARVAVQFNQGDEPALGEVRVAQAVIDCVGVAQRPPGLASRVDGASLSFATTTPVRGETR